MALRCWICRVDSLIRPGRAGQKLGPALLPILSPKPQLSSPHRRCHQHSFRTPRRRSNIHDATYYCNDETRSVVAHHQIHALYHEPALRQPYTSLVTSSRRDTRHDCWLSYVQATWKFEARKSARASSPQSACPLPIRLNQLV
jgi:hypothetical protein